MTTLTTHSWREEFSAGSRWAAKGFSRLQWRSPDSIEQFTHERLRALVIHAGSSVPFYRKRLREAGIQAERFDPERHWQRVPIISKQELRDDYPDGVVSSRVSRSRLISDRTSGSTGHPFQFFLDRRAMTSRAGSRLFFYAAMGVETPWVRVMMRPVTDTEQPGGTTIRDAGWYLEYYTQRALRVILGRHIGHSVDIPALQLNSRALPAIAQRLAAIRPDFLEIPPGRLRQIATFMLDERLVGTVRPKAIVSGAETLTDETREILSKAFGCPVFNRYGSRELGFMAQTCPDNADLLHVNSGLVFLEVVNALGRLCRPGEPGRILATDLHNFAMPLIRYDTGDVGIAAERCSCGRGVPTLGRIEGRQSTHLVLPHGLRISEAALGTLLFVRNSRDFAEKVRAYQAIQPDRETLVLKIVPSSGFLSEDARSLERYTQELFSLNVTVEIVQDLPPDASGKHQIIKRLFDSQEVSAV